jgi:predicted MPP superfamily phosphohydrolase
VTAPETAQPPRETPVARNRGRRRRLRRAGSFFALLVTILALLFGVPWWTLVLAPGWPSPATTLGTLLFAAAAVAFPFVMFLGHGRRIDTAAKAGDTTLGVIWVLFAWSVIGAVAGAVLRAIGVDASHRAVAAAVAVIAVVLLLWGYVEAMRVPRVRRTEVRIPRMGPGLDGLRVVLITDTHYGPIDRARWSGRVVEAVNSLDADIVCHTGDIADGTVEQRRDQSGHLGDVQARHARAYVTGNHEYFAGGADEWLEHLAELGWESLHNRHFVVERDGSRLVIAGVDDRTAHSTGRPGHGADHAAALAGADPDLPILLLAHQPQQITAAVEHGVDLQLSGHTHGGQIWPFHLLVRTDQPVLQGLSRHGVRTQLYTSRGTGFWGPPFRVFAPSEISLLILRAGA